MRRKKHKHTRKNVAFYKVNYGFKEPFKVLLDGNFIHATLESNLSSLDDHLPKLLGGPTRLFTTHCVMTELRQLGLDMAPAAQAARAYRLHKCGHDSTPLPPAECLLSAVGEANAAHWWVATQDRVLAAQLGEVPGVPRVFASVNGLHLSEPHERVREHAAASQAGTLMVPAHELASDALRELPALQQRDDGWKKFRRKRAQAPNPLSVRKKKASKVVVTEPASRRPGGEQRKRRRSKAKGDGAGGGAAGQLHGGAVAGE